MKRWILFLIFCLLIFNVNAQTKFKREQVIEDLDYLYQSLLETHYNLFAYSSKQKYDAHYKQLRSGIQVDSLSYIETTTLFQKLVSFANTAHCEIDFPAQAYIEYAYTDGRLFPLELAFENGKTFIRKNHSDNKEIKVGDELCSIDGVSVASILQRMSPFVSAERAYFKKAKIEFWSFPRLLFQLEGRKEEWSISIKNNTPTLKKMTVKGITVMEYEEKRNGEILNPIKKLAYFDNTAYLQPGAFSDNVIGGEERYQKFIDSAFIDMLDKKSKHLIIDLRNHPGGHNGYSDYLISYFAKKPFRWYSKFSIKSSQILKAQVRQQQDTTDSYSQAILKHKDNEIFQYNFPFYEPKPEKERFQGDVFVLINRQTYSMAAVTAALIQDYKFGSIVGEETGDVPTLYASQFSYALPQTKIAVKVPKGYIVRPNGNEKRQGVKPDITIQDHLLDEYDEILVALLKQL